ncbi:M28 family metallopeptidase [Allohahella marinimesophila]|uniref:Aminopeptidase PaaP n=1 Tax=Allohahella marinimesophila TaxID=1054972 RepID=A0ABP7P7P2_9GAMM
MQLSQQSRLRVRPAAMLLPLVAATLSLGVQASPLKNSTAVDNFWSGPAKFFECRFGILNSTPFGLPRCMAADNIVEHLKMFDDIAKANGGNRAAGLPGYDASIDYVKAELEKAGYEVKLHAFPFNAFYPQGPGVLQIDGTSYVFDTDFTYLTQTEAGDVTAPVQAVDLQLGEGNTSSSGCEPEDFAEFTAGNIALVQRGTCAFGDKATNAAAAGATGVIVFNQGDVLDDEGRTGLINATLGDAYAGGIPVVFATYDLGLTLSESAGVPVNLVADVVREQTETFNLTAETSGGNPDNVIMVGGHLDSVFEGPGANDNGSGSAAILELALQMKKARLRNKVRFAFWGAEEAGLVGSTQYVLGLTDAEKAQIKVYLNFDMIASPNYGYFIYDGDGSTFGLEGPAGSTATEKLFEKYFAIRGLPFEGSEISFRSDYAQFFEEGIPFGGLFTGAEELKTEEQAEKFGGTAGEALDPCYHAECDDISNIDMEALEINADAMAFVTSWLSLTTKPIDEEIAVTPDPETGDNRMALSVKSSAFDKTHWGHHWIK